MKTWISLHTPPCERHASIDCRCATQTGMVLISSLLILASVSLIAFGLAGDSTTELRIAGNRKLSQQAFSLGDGGAHVGVQVILDHLYEAVDPSADYPTEDEEVALIHDAERPELNLYMRGFRLEDDLLADIKGYPENDNLADPDNGSPDVVFELSTEPGVSTHDARVSVDIDRLWARVQPGSSIEFAAGYEGIGKGAGTGSVAIFYAISSTAAVEPTATDASSETPMASRSTVTTVYKKISNAPGD